MPNGSYALQEYLSADQERTRLKKVVVIVLQGPRQVESIQRDGCLGVISRIAVVCELRGAGQNAQRRRIVNGRTGLSTVDSVGGWEAAVATVRPFGAPDGLWICMVTPHGTSPPSRSRCLLTSAHQPGSEMSVPGLSYTRTSRPLTMSNL